MSVQTARGHALVLGWLRGYDRAALRFDLLAGLTAAAVVLPKAMAYATVAGLAPQIGLYTALAAPIVYGVLGRSPVLSVTTSTTIGILTGSTLAGVASGADPAGQIAAVASLSVLVGLVLIVAAIARLGFVANFISEPVLAGFKAGIGAVIILDQAPKLLGLHVHKEGFFRDLLSLARALPEFSPSTLAVSAFAVGAMLVLKRWIPRFPAALGVVVLGILASAFAHLPSRGVATIGTIPSGLPSLVRPGVSLFAELWAGAVAVALMSFTETIAAERAFSPPGEPRPSPNRELVATGAANVACGLLGGMPAGGGTTQTLVQVSGGARTQLAGMLVGLAALATLFLFAPALSLMPQAVLASIVIVYSVELLSLHDFRAIATIRRTEAIWVLAAFAGVLLLGTLRGILVAIVISLVALGYQASNPAVYEVVRKRGTEVFRRRSEKHPDDESFPGLLLVRIEGRLFFGNTERVLDLVAPLVAGARPRVLVLDCSAVFDVEYSAVRMLVEAEKRARQQGGELWLAALNPAVKEVIRRSPLGQALGPDRMFYDLTHAVESFDSRRASLAPEPSGSDQKASPAPK
jgi:high affinity sulfate transporter 1